MRLDCYQRLTCPSDNTELGGPGTEPLLTGMWADTGLEDTVILSHSTRQEGRVDREETQHVANSSSYMLGYALSWTSHFFTVNVGCLKKY